MKLSPTEKAKRAKRRRKIREKKFTRKRARPNSVLSLDDHFRSHYTESVLAIRYLSREVSVGRRGDSFPENGRYTVDGVDARIIYTRKSTPSPVLFRPSIQVLMKKE